MNLVGVNIGGGGATSKKPASIGAMIMLGGGLMVYWALSQWKLFGLGSPGSAKIMRGAMPKIKDSTTSTSTTKKSGSAAKVM